MWEVFESLHAVNCFLHGCDKISEKISLEEEEISFGSQFGGVVPMILVSIARKQSKVNASAQLTS